MDRLVIQTLPELPALDFIEFNEITMDLQLPLIWKAGLILTGVAAAIVAALVLFLRALSMALGHRADDTRSSA